MEKINRAAQIIQAIKAIEDSSLSVNQYFKENDTPFNYATYYSYKKIIKEKGVDGLIDQRRQGNNIKFSDSIKNYVKGFLENQRHTTSLKIKNIIQNEFQVGMSIRSINRFRRENNLGFIPLRKNNDPWSESGASEIIIALSLQTGLIDIISDFIYRRIQNKKRTKIFRESASFKKDHLSHRSKGKFTSSYNQLRNVRENRFRSVEEKVDKKKFDSMEIFNLSKDSIKRYCIALLSLPIVTSNGRSRSINNVKGNALKYLCGFNYKAATIDKHLRELKYLQISNELIEVVAQFWLSFWKTRNKSGSIFACYYIDGNTKALWSSKRCHKGKVTMLGRVQNCIEQLFIHDGQGHPIYFKTFNGHADLGTNGLKMMDRITEYLDAETDIKGQFAVNRILIMDGGGNAVKILREITEYYYITILDNNQISNRKLKCISKEERYEYGDAYLNDGKIELKDSNDGYILETRAVQVKWDNGRTSTLVTNLPKEIFSTSNAVKSYFDRWPNQELDFKKMKNGVNLHRMVGYGKKLVDNTNALEKIELLKKQIKKLKTELTIPLIKIEGPENKRQSLIKKETTYREKSEIIEGERNFKNKPEEQVFKNIQKQLNQVIGKIKKIKEGHGKLFNSLKKKENELARIIDKKKRYYVDVELDQLMTCYKISFANICRYFLDECFGAKKMTLQSIFESIFDLRGKVKEEDGQRKIFVNRNSKQVAIMRDLTDGFEIINKMKIDNLSGDTYSFRLV